jgi:hypothetical protein
MFSQRASLWEADIKFEVSMNPIVIAQAPFHKNLLPIIPAKHDLVIFQNPLKIFSKIFSKIAYICEKN